MSHVINIALCVVPLTVFAHFIDKTFSGGGFLPF